MRLFPPPLEIGKEEGFTSEKDIFDYQSFGERLEKFYGSFDDPVVGILDAPWGSGKTTFIKMWCGHMRNAGYPIIEFDAFKNDYTDDAFIALAGEVLSLAKDKKLTESEYKPFKERTAKIAVAAAKGAVKKALCKVFSDEGYEEMSAAAEGASDAIFKDIMDQLENRKNEQQVFAKFGDALQKLASTLGKTCDQSAPKHLIFVIDELDRCKPTFALALLEKIKHFYAVPNVHFLLVTNLNQLGNVVKCVYGSEINGEKYLQKFYDISFSLPTKSRQTSTTEEFCNYLNSKCETLISSEWFIPLAKHLNLNLREIIKIHAYAAGMVGERDNIVFEYQLIYLSLASMRVINPEYFMLAVSGAITKEHINNFLHIPPYDHVNEYNSDLHSLTHYQELLLFLINAIEKDYVWTTNLSSNFRPPQYGNQLQEIAQKMQQISFAF